MIIIPNNEIAKQMLTDFAKHWGTPEMAISSGIFRCDELDGFAAVNESGEIIGCITYTIDGKDCEIISLDSMIENKGIGTALLQQVEETAKHAHCQRIKLITTNDNVHAMAFYQREAINSPKCFRTQLKKRADSSRRFPRWLKTAF